MTDTVQQQRGSSVQSVDRAISILEHLATNRAAGVTDISRELELHKSTVFRLLATLEARGLVEQEGRKYRLGHTVVTLATGVVGVVDVVRLAAPVVDELAASTHETVTLTLLDNGEVTTGYQAVGGSVVASMDWVGQRLPLHSTASGKVFLACMPQSDREACLARPLPAMTPHTITHPARLRRDLEATRARGYGLVIEEQQVGLVAVAMAVRGMGDEVVAALTLSGPTYRVNDETLAALLAQLEASTAQVSRRAGGIKRG